MLLLRSNDAARSHHVTFTKRSLFFHTGRWSQRLSVRRQEAKDCGGPPTPRSEQAYEHMFCVPFVCQLSQDGILSASLSSDARWRKPQLCKASRNSRRLNPTA